MKKRTAKNLFWGLLIIVILLIASHYDYRCAAEDRQANEDVRQADAEQVFIDNHSNN